MARGPGGDDTPGRVPATDSPARRECAVTRGELVEMLGPKLNRLHWRKPAAALPNENTVALAEVAGGVLMRGPGGQRELVLTRPEWKLLHDAIRAGEYADTV